MACCARRICGNSDSSRCYSVWPSRPARRVSRNSAATRRRPQGSRPGRLQLASRADRPARKAQPPGPQIVVQERAHRRAGILDGRRARLRPAALHARLGAGARPTDRRTQAAASLRRLRAWRAGALGAGVDGRREEPDAERPVRPQLAREGSPQHRQPELAAAVVLQLRQRDRARLSPIRIARAAGQPRLRAYAPARRPMAL